MINSTTFGSTPAAEHLARQLNKIQDPHLQKMTARSAGVAIKGFNNNVFAIRDAVLLNAFSAKVAANLLRLLRKDATQLKIGDDEFIAALVRNVVIGSIKRAIREVTTIRKIETTTASVSSVKARATQGHTVQTQTGAHVYYSVGGHQVGFIAGDKWYPTSLPLSLCDTVTPELLHSRSMSRRNRRGTNEKSQNE